MVEQVQVPVRPAILAVNYWRMGGSLTSAAETIILGRDQASGLNDLGTQGILPDNRVGDLTAILVFNTTQISNTRASRETEQTDHVRSHLALWQESLLQLYVNGVETVRGPLSCFPHPPAWVQGGITQASAADDGFLVAQNGGYMLMGISHPISVRQSIQVRISHAAITGAATQSVMVVLQIADKKAIG